MQSDNNTLERSIVAIRGRAGQSALSSALFAFCLAGLLGAGELFAQSAAPGAAEPTAPVTESRDRASGDQTQAERRRDIVQAELARDGESRFRYARELYADGRYARARDLLEDFLLLFPEHPRRIEALRITAEIDARNGDIEAAVVRFTRAYREARDGESGARAYLQAGRLLAASGEPERARPIFEEVKRRVPSSATARLADQELLALELPRAAAQASDERPLLNDAGDSAESADAAEKPAAESVGEAANGPPTTGATRPQPQTGRRAAPDSRDARGTRGAREEPAQSGPILETGRDARGDALDRMGEGVEAPATR